MIRNRSVESGKKPMYFGIGFSIDGSRIGDVSYYQATCSHRFFVVRVQPDVSYSFSKIPNYVNKPYYKPVNSSGKGSKPFKWIF